MLKDQNKRWSHLRSFCPEIFDKLALEYARMRGVQLPSAKAMLARNSYRLLGIEEGKEGLNATL